MTQQLKVAALLAALVIGRASAGAAQTTAAESREAMLARGWTRLAAGQHDEAAAIATRALARDRDHDALSLAVAARVAQGRVVAGLDSYQQWLKSSRAEDLFVLELIARGSLEEIAGGKDRGLALRALQALVQSGVPGASERLARLRGAVNPSAVRPEARIEALKAAGPSSVPALREAARDQQGPARAAAIRALGALNAHEATEDARAMLNDADPLVRASAAVALARFGDPDGESRVKQMLESPVADVRLIGAEAYVGRGDGPWTDAIVPLLDDPNGLNRLRAAELLAPVKPELARPVLEKAASDPNPVVRADAARILAAPEVGLADAAGLPGFRRMLRDADPAVRLEGGIGIVALAAPSR